MEGAEESFECEKCGALFESFDAAERCERSHCAITCDAGEEGCAGPHVACPEQKEESEEVQLLRVQWADQLVLHCATALQDPEVGLKDLQRAAQISQHSQQKLIGQGLHGHAMLLQRYDEPLRRKLRDELGAEAWHRYAAMLADGIRNTAPKVKAAITGAAHIAGAVTKHGIAPAAKCVLSTSAKPVEVPMSTRVALGSAQLASAAAVKLANAMAEGGKLAVACLSDSLLKNTEIGKELQENPRLRAAGACWGAGGAPDNAQGCFRSNSGCGATSIRRGCCCSH